MANGRSTMMDKTYPRLRQRDVKNVLDEQGIPTAGPQYESDDFSSYLRSCGGQARPGGARRGMQSDTTWACTPQTRPGPAPGRCKLDHPRRPAISRGWQGPRPHWPGPRPAWPGPRPEGARAAAVCHAGLLSDWDVCTWAGSRNPHGQGPTPHSVPLGGGCTTASDSGARTAYPLHWPVGAPALKLP